MVVGKIMGRRETKTQGSEIAREIYPLSGHSLRHPNSCPAGDIGRQSYPERVVDGLEGFLLQLEISGGEPNAIVPFFNAKFLTGETRQARQRLAPLYS
jgi:hypothetical protein